jgi:cytochrome c-type biogenesis protein CcmH
MKAVRAALLLWLLAWPALAAPEPFPDPAMETRARSLQRELRCLVCQTESIDDSHAPLAADLRQTVRRLMAEGRSNAQIKDYLVARYGDFILMQPPLQANTWLLWLAPFLVLGAAGGSAVWIIRRAREQVPTDEAAKIENIADF